MAASNPVPAARRNECGYVVAHVFKRNRQRLQFLHLVKTLLALLAALALAGCTTFNKQDACAAAQTAYSVYLAVINADGQPSKDQILAAQAAAAVLQSQCGWTPPAAQKSKRAAMVDARNVPILLPPK